jgi:predicted deacetylase
MMWETPNEAASAAQPTCNNTHDRGALLVTLHDVTPAHADRLARAERRLAALGLPAVTYLFVPNYHGHSPAEADPTFLDWCRAPRPFGVDWMLHGYFHREDPGRAHPRTIVDWWARTFMTDGEGEFLALHGRALDNRLRAGIDAFTACFGMRPTGFVAPAWLYNDDLLPALARARVRITESHFHVFDLNASRALPSPVVTWASRSLLHRQAARTMAAATRRLCQRAPLLRVALHPSDFDHAPIVDSICRTIDAVRAGRRVITYSAIMTPHPESR